MSIMIAVMRGSYNTMLVLQHFLTSDASFTHAIGRHHSFYIISARVESPKDKGGDSSPNTGTTRTKWVPGVDYNPETQSVKMLTLYRPFEPSPLNEDAEIL